MIENLITVDDVAKMLNIKRLTVYGLVFKKQIPCVKLSGRALRFKESEISDWLNGKSQAVGQNKLSGAGSPNRRRTSVGKHISSVNGVARIVKMAKKSVLNQ